MIGRAASPADAWPYAEADPKRRALVELFDAATDLRGYANLLLDPEFRRTAAGEMVATTGAAAVAAMDDAVARLSAAAEVVRAQLLGRPELWELRPPSWDE